MTISSRTPAPGYTAFNFLQPPLPARLHREAQKLCRVSAQNFLFVLLWNRQGPDDVHRSLERNRDRREVAAEDDMVHADGLHGAEDRGRVETYRVEIKLLN